MALINLRLVATKRHVGLGLVIICALGLTACSSGQSAATTTSSSTTTSSTTTTARTAPEPTFGQLAVIFSQGKGFGEVRPSEFFNGGDPTGLVTHIVWKSWGTPRAIGTAVSEYVAPNQDVAEGTEQTATIVAFKLGYCLGNYVYEAVEWYFPQHGQRFSPDQYENICTGGFVTSATTAPTCPPSHLKVGIGPLVGGATGQRAMSIALTNSGPGTCMLYGYPLVRLVTAAGATLHFSYVTQSQYIKKTAPRRVLLGVGAIAYVEMVQYRCDLGVLQNPSHVQLVLPGAGPGTVLTVPGGLSYCKGGPTDSGNTIAVTPVESTLVESSP